MTVVRDSVSLHEKTVKRAAKGALEAKKRRSKMSSRPRNSKVKTAHWSDGVDPRVVEAVKKLCSDHRRIKVVSSTEVIITN